MEEYEDCEKDSLAPIVDQPNAEFFLEILGAGRIVANAAFGGSLGLEALQPSPFRFIALVNLGGAPVGKVEARGAFRSHSKEMQKLA